MLKLYGNMKSGPCKKVRYAAEAVGIPYEWVELDFAADTKTDEHLARHPAGKLPAMDDDGFVLFESDAICKYLARSRESALYPRDLKSFAVVEQWLLFVSNHVGAAMNKVAYNRVLAPLMGREVDSNSLKEGLSFLDRFLPVVDARLGAVSYLAGELSLADISLLSVFDYADAASVDLSGYEHLSRWLNEMRSQAFWKKFQT